MSSQCLEFKSIKRSQTCILNGNGYKIAHLLNETSIIYDFHTKKRYPVVMPRENVVQGENEQQRLLK